MPFPRPGITTLRQQAMGDITASDLPNADGFLRRAVLRVLAWTQAGLAYLHYGYLDWISLQAVPFTATGEFLDAWAALAPTPVIREAPTPATGAGAWSSIGNSPLPIGTVLNRGDNFQYVTTSNAPISGGVLVATFVASIPGTLGNADLGTPLTLATAIAGVSPAGAATTAITGGTDLEQDGPLRARMLESYTAPPLGGDSADYVTWALGVPGVTRAWCLPQGGGPGTVSVYFMEDVVEAAFGGVPQGTNGVAALETRDVAATGDQLIVANAIYAKRNVTALVYALAPALLPQAFTFGGLTATTTAQQAQVRSALVSLFLLLDSAIGATSIQQSDVAAAVAAVPGLPDFTITVPAVWPLVSPVGSLLAVGAVAFP